MSEVANIALLPGESRLFSADFTPHAIFRHHKNGLLITDKRVATIHPQYIFWFIRVGQSISAMPHDRVAQVTHGRVLNRRNVFMAMGLGVVGLYLLMMGMAGVAYGGAIGALMLLVALVVLGLAAFQLWLARQIALTVDNIGGGSVSVAVDTAEQQHMLAAIAMIEQLALGRQVQPYAPAPAPQFAPPAQHGSGQATGPNPAMPGWGQQPNSGGY